MLPHPLSVRGPSVLRDVPTSEQGLEFAAQPYELFGETGVFGAQIRELLGASQRM
jgi:hypothetical protein